MSRSKNPAVRRQQNKRRNERRRANRTADMVATGKTNVRVPPAVNNRPKPQRMRRRGLRMVSDGASTQVTYSELWRDSLPIGVTNLYFRPGNSGLAKLDDFARNWDQFVLEECELSYKTSTGTTVSGHLFMGVDYSGQDVASSSSDVTALENKADGPVWENQVLHVDMKKAMTKDVMYTGVQDVDNTPFVLAVSSEVAQPGVVWCRYKIRFQSPKRDTTSSVPVLASVQADIVSSPAGIVEVGVPEINIGTDGSVSQVKTYTHTATSQFVVDTTITKAASPGDQYVITANAPTSMMASNGSGQNVVFYDSATGQQLTPDIVRQVSAGAGNGSIWSAVWQFFKPYAKTFLIETVETLLGSSTNAQPFVGQVEVLVSNKTLGPLPIIGQDLTVMSDSDCVELVRQSAGPGAWVNATASLAGTRFSTAPAGSASDQFQCFVNSGQSVQDGVVFRVKGQYVTTGSSVLNVTVIGNGTGTTWMPQTVTNTYFSGWLRVNGVKTAGYALFEVDHDGTSASGDRFVCTVTPIALDSVSSTPGVPTIF